MLGTLPSHRTTHRTAASRAGRGAKSRSAALRWRSWLLRIAVILGVLLLLRAMAPWVLRSAINHRLASLPDYWGHVADIDLNLWRGAYALEKVEVRQQSGEVGAPFLSADRIDFSLAWRQLLRGRVVSDISIQHAKLTLVRGETPETTQLEADRGWQDVVEDIFPIDITRLEISRGDLQFVDQTRDPHVDVSLHDIELVATGLRNRIETTHVDELPAAIILTGRTVGDGSLRAELRLAPLERRPRFDLDLAIEELSLPALNQLLRAYANVDVSHGYFELYLEVAARDGAYRGYVKPFFRELDFENLSDRDRSLLGRFWESIVNVMDDILKNPERRRLGTRVPFSGNFNDTDVGTWTGVINTIRYGFGEAFSEAVEGDIQPRDVAPATPTP